MLGDVIIFYTDGVTEAENRFGEEFGLARLLEQVRRASSLSAEDLMNDIFKKVMSDDTGRQAHWYRMHRRRSDFGIRSQNRSLGHRPHGHPGLSDLDL